MKKLLLVLLVVTLTSFLFVGCLPTRNTAPVITTTTLPNGTVGTAYTATVEAFDADGDALTFSLVSEQPTDMVISEAGVISGWTPDEVGTVDVTVAVTDGIDSVSATFTITVVAAPVTPVAPVITAIPDQEVFWDEDGWTYQVEVTPGTGTILTYSLIGAPVSMTIDANGLITWATILDIAALHEVTVKVVADDGEFDEETFIIEVKEPIVEPLVIDIDIPDAYPHPTKGLIVARDCYDIVVTFSDNSITEDQDVWVRWNDVPKDCEGAWILLTGNADDTEFTGEICFGCVCSECSECVDICIEVLVGDLCCASIIYSETIKVDSIEPCASFTVTIEDCLCTPGAKMSWTTTCLDICDVPYDCCGDACSGVGDWMFVLDDDICLGPCDSVEGNDCPITGAFECGCLLYATEEGENVEHVIDVSIKDNVGNEFTDTWTLIFDTDSVVSFSALNTTPYDNSDGTWSLDYECTWVDCEECMPMPEQG